MYTPIPKTDYHHHFYAYPHLHGFAPFRMVGNLYYVGDDNVGIHLIDTGDGLILIDSGYPENQAWLIQSIWQLGYNPSMIRYIVHTHGHFDHMGTTALLQQLSSNVKTVMSAIDAAAIRENPDLITADCHDFCHGCIFDIDVELSDGDHIRLGNTDLWVKPAPGHTMGTLAIFFTVQDGDRTLIAGMHGGMGYGTMYREYMEKYHIVGAREAFAEGLVRLQDEHVDILLGNHTGQNQLMKKREQLLSGAETNPFIDPTEWKSMLIKAQANFEKFCRENP
ncbi:MAG: MBL fold metallo-hydrolase [Ruminococcaceae bacterium]|nr:MBL fold metallo-hydrolase [Oscillospiraceae bacterium]